MSRHKRRRWVTGIDWLDVVLDATIGALIGALTGDDS